MSKIKSKISRNTALLSAFIVFVSIFSAISAKAQSSIKVYKVGERVEVNVANDIEHDDRWVKGTVTEVIPNDNGSVFSYKVKMDGSFVQQFLNRERLIRPLNDAGGKNSTPSKKDTASDPVDASEQVGDAGNNKTSSDCSFDKYPQVTPSMKFSQAFIKAELYERYSYETNTGSLSSPLGVGLTFLNIQTKPVYTNTIKVVPGRGAQRKQDGAPVNAAIYPFKAKYIVCKKFAREVTKTQYESDFVCFKDKTGNWNCPVDGVPKITYLK